MSSLKDIVQNQKGKAGSGQSWRVDAYPASDGEISSCILWHYDTVMLQWNSDDPSDRRVLFTSIGHGSVSDQNGMNIAFRTLGLPYRYDRDIKGGGARITELETR